MATAFSVARLECLLIADDLTGACDAAVHFAVRGYPTAVSVSPDFAAGDSPVAAISTNSRDLGREQIERLMRQLASSQPFRSARILFKKIDSTLRGSGGCEIAAALAAFDCDAAVVTPALPAMRRVVEAGMLRVIGDPDFQLIGVAGRLRAQGVDGCSAVRPHEIAAAIRMGVRVVTVDADCDADLDAIASEGRALEGRILWAGSAGLAAALARSMPGGGSVCQVPKVRRGPVLFCIGSDHAVTLTQQDALAAERSVVRMCAGRITADQVAGALAQGEHVLLTIPRGRFAAADLRELLAVSDAAGMLLSGGDTASLVCQAAHVERIECYDEIVPGIPFGPLRGGLLDGMMVATKSGGFGDRDALIRVADFFSCPQS